MLIGYIFNILLRILYDITSIHTKNELHHKKVAQSLCSGFSSKSHKKCQRNKSISLKVVRGDT